MNAHSFALVLAQVAGDDMVHSLIVLFVIGLILGLLWWGASTYLPEPIQKAVKICIGVVGLLIVTNFLLSLIGKPLVKF